MWDFLSTTIHTHPCLCRQCLGDTLHPRSPDRSRAHKCLALSLSPYAWLFHWLWKEWGPPSCAHTPSLSTLLLAGTEWILSSNFSLCRSPSYMPRRQAKPTESAKKVPSCGFHTGVYRDSRWQMSSVFQRLLSDSSERRHLPGKPRAMSWIPATAYMYTESIELQWCSTSHVPALQPKCDHSSCCGCSD